MRKRHRYVTVIVNGDTGRTLAMVEHRSSDTLSAFLMQQGENNRLAAVTVIKEGLRSLRNPRVKIDHSHNHPVLLVFCGCCHQRGVRPSSYRAERLRCQMVLVASTPQLQFGYPHPVLDFPHDVVGTAVGAEHIEGGPFHLETPLPHILYRARPELGVGVNERLEPPMHDPAP